VALDGFAVLLPASNTLILELDDSMTNQLTKSYALAMVATEQ
jgi:hypothetical protein